MVAENVMANRRKVKSQSPPDDEVVRLDHNVLSEMAARDRVDTLGGESRRNGCRC